MAVQSIFWKGLFTFISILSVIPQGSFAESNNSYAPSATIPRLAGCINLPGFEFGAQTSGLYTAGSVPVPPPDSQIPHFLKQNVNLFRVPVAWDSLQAHAKDKLNATMLTTYQTFIEKITDQGAYAIIDVHSYGRYQGQTIGEAAPADNLISLWTQLGGVFKDNPLVMLGISNEPHDQNIEKWGAAVQLVVNALRKASINNVILLPGIEYTSMGAFPDWYKTMKNVKNPDGTFKGLIFEVHRYLDSDNSGKSTQCVNSHAEEVKKVAELLKSDNRQVILAEVGGGSTPSCEEMLPQIAGAVKDAYPIFVGFAMWAAGAFDEKYELVTTVKDASSPTGWKDQSNWLSIKKFLPTDPVTPGSKTAAKRKRKSRCRA